MAKALNDTSNCGKSGSNKALLACAEGNKNSAQSIFALTAILKEQTNEDGQLAILSGDLSQLTGGFHKVAAAINSFCDALHDLSKNMDHESLDGVDQVTSGLEDVAKSLAAFSIVFNGLKFPSNFLVKLLTTLTTFNKGITDSIAGINAVKIASSAAQKRCQVSTGVPEALGDVVKEGTKLSKQIQL